MLSSIVWDVDPTIFEIGSRQIRWYGLMWGIGFILAYKYAEWLFKKEKYPEEWVDKLFVYSLVSVVVGARLGHCLFYQWDYYTSNPVEILKIWEGGLASHGGAIGLLIAAWLLNKKEFSKEPKFHTSLLWIMDRLVVGVCVTATLIRLGNLMNSEIYGTPTDLPWGFIFVRDGQTVPCHPTQIYEMIYCIVGFVVTWLMYWKAKAYKREGLLLGVFLEIIFFTRFMLEFIKNDQELFEAGHILNMGQILSLPFIIWGIYLIIRAFKRPALP